ncbi:MAG: heavy-metal-associated domain-containing protein [Methanomassiliicoccaceae archaeon]|nr:heavy-metal-associated domain-containing protein [Methanomassiliicoccaceae archaeon]MCL2145782.1 heavy-metal-associated domain-containing protein [Methanomassiliicoccaceae archaeon]
MAKTVLKIDGMSCEMCSKKVSDALLDTEGVTDVKVDLKKGTAEVMQEGVKDEDLIRAVLDAGFRSKVKHGLF